MRYLSPLRYPGGKGCLSEFLQNVVEVNGLRGCAYFEPFAGGREQPCFFSRMA